LPAKELRWSESEASFPPPGTGRSACCNGRRGEEIVSFGTMPRHLHRLEAAAYPVGDKLRQRSAATLLIGVRIVFVSENPRHRQLGLDGSG
jgi:hypothetical protein